jgi:BolA family transcriptional regulator, general stress-responsive regulator
MTHDNLGDTLANPSTSSHSARQLEQRLRDTLQPGKLEVLDESGDHAGHAGANGTGFGTHFRVRISSPLFTGKTRVACHRLVYDSLQVFIDEGVHAIAIETEIPLNSPGSPRSSRAPQSE